MLNGSDFFSEEAYNEALFEEQSIPFANESQAALDASRREANIVRQDREIAKLLSEGKSVIVESFIHYCPRTDAIMGSSLLIKSVFDTVEEAQAAYEALNPEEACHEDYGIDLRIPQAEVTVTAAALDDSDIPF